MTEYIKQYNMNYRQTHAIKLKKQQGVKSQCLCGGHYTHSNKARHLQSHRHNIRKYISVTA